MKKLILTFGLSIPMTIFAACPTPSSSLQLSNGIENTVQFVWHLDSAANWQAVAVEPVSSNIRSYMSYIAAETNTNQIYLLKKQQTLYAGIYGQDSLDVRQFQAIIDRQIGTISKASCLDQILLSRQFSYTPYTGEPTEFMAFVFQKGNQLRLHGAFRKTPAASGPPINFFDAQIKQLINQGWKFIYLLHNHPFNLNNEYGDIGGTVIGSDADFSTFSKRMSTQTLQFGRITNGFDSAMYNKSDVQRFQDL